MQSLTELNLYNESASLEFQDDRLAGLVLLGIVPTDRTLTIQSTQVNLEQGYDILEIINYATTDLQITFEIITDAENPLVGSTISWSTLPSYVTLTTTGSRYVLTGFKTAQDWDLVKNPVWNLPANYADLRNWYVLVTIDWYAEEVASYVNVTYENYDPRYYFLSKMVSNFSLDCIPKRDRGVSASLSSTFEIEINADIDLRSKFILACSVVEDPLRSNFALVVSPSLNAIGSASLPVLSSVSASLTEYIGVSNMDNRTYNSNVKNLIFATLTPEIIDPITTGSYTIQLTASSGVISDTDVVTSPSSIYSFTGTLAECNAKFASIRYFPNKNFTSTATVEYRHSRDGSVIKIKSFSLTHAGVGTFTPRTYDYVSAGTFNWTPQYEEFLYGKIDYLVVGAGGGGGGNSTYNLTFPGYLSAGGGGGAGAIEFRLAQTITNAVYPLTVGAGGTAGALGNTGGRGGNSVFNSLSAEAGYGGNLYPGSVPDPESGGRSGDLVIGGIGANSGFTAPFCGGGGGGPEKTDGLVDRNGGNATNTSGGRGGPEVSTTLTGGYIVTTSGGGAGGGGTIPQEYTSPGSGGKGANRSSNTSPNPASPGKAGRILIRVNRV